MELFYLYPATCALIAANIVASVIAFSNETFLYQNLFHVRAVRQGREWHRMLTAGFLHVGIFHLLVNMWVLFLFGMQIEAQIGTFGFLVIYFAALLGGNFWTLVENYHKPDYRALGASGATSGIVVAFCLFAPFAQLIFFVIPMPAIVFALGFIVLSAVLAQRENKVIGHEAHLGGALAGLVATLILAPSAFDSFLQQLALRLGGGA